MVRTISSKLQQKNLQRDLHWWITALHKQKS